MSGLLAWQLWRSARREERQALHALPDFMEQQIAAMPDRTLTDKLRRRIARAQGVRIYLDEMRRITGRRAA